MEDTSNQPQHPAPIEQPQAPSEPLRIGIICNETNRVDLLHYKAEFMAINAKYQDDIQLVFFGYNGEDGDDNWLEGVDFEYVKPVTIVHYFRQLLALRLHLIFVPLIRNEYNATSENYNKYLEAGICKIPLMTINLYPYNKLINDKHNGFLYKEKSEFMAYIDLLNSQRELTSVVGNNAEADVRNNFDYSPDNIKVLTDLFV